MVYDLHCDLLSYLASHPYRLAYNDESRSSISQLIAGDVQLQTLAVFTTTNPRSVKSAMAQLNVYKDLSERYVGYFYPYFQAKNGQIATLFAFENASGFCTEDEPLGQGIKRLKSIVGEIGKPLYVSLTWNLENRFGGGSSTTKIGLKEDGKRLLEEMQGFCHAIDLSHTSDWLANDIFTFIDKKKLSYRVIASHSNLRKIQDVPRNLPDEIADEIVRRGGIIGFNFIRSFLGSSMQSFLKHVEYALKRGYGKNLALGADFFYEGIMPRAFYKPAKEYFFDGFDTSGSYPKLLTLLRNAFSKEQAENIAQGNLKRFLNTV